MIHVEIANGEKKIEMKGPEIVLYTECGKTMKCLFNILEKNHGKEQAKKMIHRLAESAVLSDEEAENKVNNFRAKNPHLTELSDAVFRHFFGG